MIRVRTINGGSSSIKFALFEPVEAATRSLNGQVERIGLANTVINAKGANGLLTRDEALEGADLERAGERLIDWLGKHTDLEELEAVGHRVVHGGPHDARAQRITPGIGPLDPDHPPWEIALINTFLRRLPGVPQVACFGRRWPPLAALIEMNSTTKR